jgi:putative DNA methylase
MVWDFAEGNPFSDSSGSWSILLENLLRSYNSPLFNFRREFIGHVNQMDATSAAIIKNPIYITDPPYYDNIGYSDISDFFYVWLRKALIDIYPDSFSTLLTPKKQELIATPYRFEGDSQKAEDFFFNGFVKAFTLIRDNCDEDYPVIIYYAFKQSEQEDDSDDGTTTSVSTGWERMLSGVLSSGFQVTGTWPIRTEMNSRMVGQGTNALASSIVISCKKRPNNANMVTRREYISILRHELPLAIKRMQNENIAPVDLAQASIGPGIAVFSRYSRVLESDGSSMTVRTALQIINQELEAYLKKEENEMDNETQFLVDWFEQFGMNEGPYGSAEILSNAKNISIDKLAKLNILKSKAGKVSIISRDSYPSDWNIDKDTRITLWECTQYLIKKYQNDGEVAAAELAYKLGIGKSEDAKNLAYRLYSISERKGWADEAIAYNDLVTSWPDISKLLASLSGKGPQKTLDINS